MNIKKLSLGLFVCFVLINVVLLYLYLLKTSFFVSFFNKNDNKPANVASENVNFNKDCQFELRSEDLNIQLELKDAGVLNSYAKQFRLCDDKRLGISVGTAPIEWVTAEKIILVFSPEVQSNYDVLTPNGQPLLSFEVKRGEEGGVYYLYFNYAYELLPPTDLAQRETFSKNLSASVIRILYLVTHYGPKGVIKEEEIGEILQSYYADKATAIDVSFVEQ